MKRFPTKTNLQERENLEKKLIENSYSKFDAKFYSWRRYLAIKSKLLPATINYLHKKYGESIEAEEDPQIIAEKIVYGTLKTIGSYPILLISGIATLVTKEPGYLMGIGLGSYLNLRGNIEWFTAEERLYELGLDREKTIDDFLEKRLGIKKEEN